MTCPICGAPHSTCGPAARSTPVTISDLSRAPRYTGADLRRYRYELNGMEATGMLNPHDAARLGAVLVEDPLPPPVEDLTPPPVEVKARRPANKARRPATKEG